MNVLNFFLMRSRRAKSRDGFLQAVRFYNQ